MKSGLDFKKFKDITLLIISTYNLKLLIDGKKTNDSQYELNRSQNTVEKLTSISDLLSAEIKKKKDNFFLKNQTKFTNNSSKKPKNAFTIHF